MLKRLRYFFSALILFYVLVIASSNSHGWDRWGVSYSGDSSIGNYIWTIDDSTGDSTKVSTKLFNGNGWQSSNSYVNQQTGDLVIKSSSGDLHSYNLATDTWTEISNPDTLIPGNNSFNS
mgnify:CR=1 FL=1